MNVNCPFGPRFRILWKQSYIEAGFDDAEIPDSEEGVCVSLFPESFVNEVQKIGFKKIIDYNFRGAVYIDEKTSENRKWVLDYAKNNFTRRSYFQATDWGARRRLASSLYLRRRHRKLGSFDYTFERTGFVPKDVDISKRGYFDPDYFKILCESEYTLCPAGDMPWSMRFYEAILCKSIPIVETLDHTGRNQLEYDIGYRYLLAGETLKSYPQDWADENFEKFIQHQTLIKAGKA